MHVFQFNIIFESTFVSFKKDFQLMIMRIFDVRWLRRGGIIYLLLDGPFDVGLEWGLPLVQMILRFPGACP
jgi:hypothetical protein